MLLLIALEAEVEGCLLRIPRAGGVCGAGISTSCAGPVQGPPGPGPAAEPGMAGGSAIPTSRSTRGRLLLGGVHGSPSAALTVPPASASAGPALSDGTDCTGGAGGGAALRGGSL